MNAETTDQIIKQLSDKLGTTTEHLWGVLSRQAPVSCVIDIFMLLFLSAVSAVSFWIGRKMCESDDWGSDHPMTMCLFVASAMFAFVVIIFACSNAALIAAGFFNPEYWALKQLIK